MPLAGAEDQAQQVDEAGIRELVAMSGRVLHQQNLVDYLGHVSHRLPGDRLVIKPKFSPRTRGHHSVGAADLVVVDLDGRQLSDGDRPPAEVFIHAEIYRARPDVQAVVHTHQPLSTLMGVMGATIHPILHVQSALLSDVGELPTWPSPVLVTTPERGRAVAEVLGQHSACHLQGHGVVTVGDDVMTATVRAIMLEQLADANLRILQAGGQPRVITEEERASLQQESGPVAARWAYYTQLVEEASR